MLSLTTGQLHDLLVSFTRDYPGRNIRSILLYNDLVSIICVDSNDIQQTVRYGVKTSVEFVNAED